MTDQTTPDLESVSGSSPRTASNQTGVCSSEENDHSDDEVVSTFTDLWTSPQLARVFSNLEAVIEGGQSLPDVWSDEDTDAWPEFWATQVVRNFQTPSPSHDHSSYPSTDFARKRYSCGCLCEVPRVGWCVRMYASGRYAKTTKGDSHFFTVRRGGVSTSQDPS